VVRRLKEAGAIVLGKVTTHEFALGFDSPPTKKGAEFRRVRDGFAHPGNAARVDEVGD